MREFRRRRETSDLSRNEVKDTRSEISKKEINDIPKSEGSDNYSLYVNTNLDEHLQIYGKNIQILKRQLDRIIVDLELFSTFIDELKDNGAFIENFMREEIHLFKDINRQYKSNHGLFGNKTKDIILFFNNYNVFNTFLNLLSRKQDVVLNKFNIDMSSLHLSSNFNFLDKNKIRNHPELNTNYVTLCDVMKRDYEDNVKEISTIIKKTKTHIEAYMLHKSNARDLLQNFVLFLENKFDFKLSELNNNLDKKEEIINKVMSTLNEGGDIKTSFSNLDNSFFRNLGQLVTDLEKLYIDIKGWEEIYVHKNNLLGLFGEWNKNINHSYNICIKNNILIKQKIQPFKSNIESRSRIQSFKASNYF